MKNYPKYSWPKHSFVKSIPAFRGPAAVAEDDQDEDGDEEEADHGLEHGEQTLDGLVVVILLLSTIPCRSRNEAKLGCLAN
jgi:hypothetical protein